MVLKKLDVPTSSITEVKKSPMDVFAQARTAKTGVYVFNREKVAGVMLAQEQYEELLEELDSLRAMSKRPTKEAKPTIQATPVEEPVMSVKEEVAEVIPAGLENIAAALAKFLVKGNSMSARVLDEEIVGAGFITKKSGFGGVTDMLHELTKTGKLTYQMRKKEQGQTVFVEIYAALEEHGKHSDQLLIQDVKLIQK